MKNKKLLKYNTEEANKVIESRSNGRYTFEHFDFIGVNNTIVKCKCNTCNSEWESSFRNLDERNYGCPACSGRSNGNRLRYSDEEARRLLEEVANGAYTFEFIGGYKNSSVKCKCNCNVCGTEFFNSYSNLYYGKNGCPKCKKLLKYTEDSLIEKLTEVSNGRYTFSFTEFKRAKTKVKCKCNKCGYEFTNSASNLINWRQGCNQCSINRGAKSIEETEIIEYLNKRGIKTIQSYKCIKSPVSNHKMEIDIYLPQLNIGIEYNDLKSHLNSKIKTKCKGYFNSTEEYHNYKTHQAELLGIELIHINARDYYEDKDKVLSDIFNKCLNNMRLNEQKWGKFR